MGLSTHMKTFDEYIIESISREDIIARDLLKHKKTLGSKYSIALKHLNKGNLDQAQRFIDAIKEGTESLDEGTESLDEGTESLDEGTESLDEAASRGLITKENPFITIHVKGSLAGQMAFAVAADRYELPAANRKKVVAALIKGGVGKKIDISKHISGWYDNYKIERLPNPGKVQFALSQHHAKELGEGTESLDEGTESLDEAKTMAQRLKMKQTFRKNKAKIALGRKKAGRKLADKDTLMKRARKHARDLLVKKLTKGKGKDELSFAQRQNIEKQVDKKKGAIDRIAKKLLPKLRQLDKDKLKKKKG